LSSPGHRRDDDDGDGADGGGHGRLECETLVGLSALQREHPGLAESLLGGSTIYLRFVAAQRHQESLYSVNPKFRHACEALGE